MPGPPSPQVHRPVSRSPSAPAHSVQFYDPRFFPAGSIADFFSSGLQAGEGAFVVATAGHLQLVKDSLQRGGADLAALERTGRLICIDAFSALQALRDGGPLTSESFAPLFASPLNHAINSAPSGRVRLFAEIADLLASERDYSACAELERYWNNPQALLSLRLYCAYSTAAFPDPPSATFLCELCNLHDEVVPVVPAPGRQDWLGLLLERSHALQAEIHSRKAVENALRSIESAYAELFDEQLLQSLDRFDRPLVSSVPFDAPQLADLSADLRRVLQISLRDILLACKDACAARRSAMEGGAEWHRSTGEILAYGKLTHVLFNLQQCARTQNSR